MTKTGQVNNTMRLAKFLAVCGLASRRQAEVLISGGLVKVNGQVVTKLSTQIEIDHDQVEVRGRILKIENKVYYLLHKPVGYLSSVQDPHHQKLVTNLVPTSPKVWPVGRLDKDSRGLLLLTNDGDLTYLLTHPKHAVKKVYQVELNKIIDAKLLSKLKQGVDLEEGLAQVDSIKKISNTSLEITIHQGWNRQIRRMLAACGYKVLDLIRIKEGSLSLGDLGVGEYRILNKEEIK